jgi:serine protease Do
MELYRPTRARLGPRASNRRQPHRRNPAVTRPAPLPFFARTPPLLLLLLFAWSVAVPLSALAAEVEDGILGPPADLDELKAIEAQVQAVVAKALPATVAVRVGQSQGSGIVVGSEGYVLTAGHVAGSPGQQVTLIFPDGKSVQAKSLGVDRRLDAGLLKISDEGKWPSVEMGRSADLLPGSWCIAVGHPLGYQKERPPVFRLGRVLRPVATVIQTDCALVAGDSGGPLLDLEGKVVGINSRIATSTSMNFHVPVDVFHDDWDRLVKGETIEQDVPARDGEPVRNVFGQLVAASAACVVRVYCGDSQVALGTVVGPDGWILTKASELKGPAVCRLADDRRLDARLVGVHPGFDLAMLKVDARNLPEIVWSGRRNLAVGAWVAAPGPESGPPMAVGVIGVPRRKIPPPSGILGVTVADGDKGARVVNVLPDSAAQKAGIKPDDLITHVNGKTTPGQTQLVEAIRRNRPGAEVQLRVRRGDETLKIAAKLTTLDTPATKKREMQNNSGVGISDRHEDFPTVLQHDTVLKPSDCGGPLVDLTGRVVGVNIARGGRTETYAVPSDVLSGLMYDLISGRLAPAEPEPKPETKPEPKAEPKEEAKPDAKPQPPAEKSPPEEKPKQPAEPAPQAKPAPSEQPPQQPDAKPAAPDNMPES